LELLLAFCVCITEVGGLLKKGGLSGSSFQEAALNHVNPEKSCNPVEDCVPESVVDRITRFT
jgi:hypothetical protein